MKSFSPPEEVLGTHRFPRLFCTEYRSQETTFRHFFLLKKFLWVKINLYSALRYQNFCDALKGLERGVSSPTATDDKYRRVVKQKSFLFKFPIFIGYNLLTRTDEHSPLISQSHWLIDWLIDWYCIHILPAYCMPIVLGYRHGTLVVILFTYLKRGWWSMYITIKIMSKLCFFSSFNHNGDSTLATCPK